MAQALTCELLLAAYTNGYFPMAEDRDNPQIRWYNPELRGVLPLDGFHIPKSFAKFLRKHPFTLTTDQAFREIMQGCAERERTWINDEIIALYSELAQKGFAHSVECWENDQLVGGLYGVAIGGAFFGESMFSRVPGASKVALVQLVTILKQAGYVLLDTQYSNEHLLQFGVTDIPREAYLSQLETALAVIPTVFAK